MLAYLDPILFPDQCLVYEIEPDRYVYPIFKNGSSSLGAENFRQLNYFELRKIKVIEVYLRDPYERYVSGVQTYLNHLGPEYHRETTLKFIREFLFLNRHFALQFHWLVNLARHSDAWIQLRPIEELNTATENTWNTLSRDPALLEYFKDNTKLHYYLTLDKILVEELMGQCLSFGMIMTHIKRNHPAIYNEVIERVISICGVLD